MSQAKQFLEDIQTDAIAGPYPEFFRKYFGNNISNNGSSAENEGPCTSEVKEPAILKTLPTLKNVAEWLNAVYGANGNTSNAWSTLPSSRPIRAECPGSGLVLEPKNDDGWGEALMIGFAVDEMQLSYPLSLAQLYVLARQVFLAQPFRYSLHGVLVHGDVVEFWVFDRSGMYCSEPLSLERDYAQLRSIFAGFANKTNEELGITPVLQRDDGGAYVLMGDEQKRLYLQDEPFVDKDGFFGAGMLCYRAKFREEEDWTHVVKFKWRDCYHEPEEDAFNHAQEKGIPGVVSLVHHVQIEETAKLRSRLRHKRCKDLHLESQSDNSDAKGLLKYVKEGRSYFSNRFFTCLVFTPLGRPVHTWRSSLELLVVLRDAVKAHRSLLQDANMLHRDISAGNIIIIGSDEVPKGMLIDLDRAMNLDKEQPVAGNIAGTRMFTAIGLLKLAAQSYRHDLESFFYLFLWLVFCQGDENLPRDSFIKAWDEDDRKVAAHTKMNGMGKERFDEILGQFDSQYESLKDVAWDLRAAIFRPDDDGELWLGTDATEEGTNAIYNAILASFDKGIKALRDN